ncbi:DUF5313 family protein [Rhodococcoides yunnanense]|jgi:hypothetical protein|uniref:DUF5313 family protein n=1 Tax=Rhodococcoides yunnanense TaxID=278209 RepID=UPI0022B17287|nr:DUF5313 family protein [Rhodococcus yunnanensis]MCZ4275473.1 DUF5313 family protein [Rhodococcus yunnanensis]
MKPGPVRTAPQPSAREIAGYVFFGQLPAQYADWVIHDITGPGATRRYATRFIVPLLPLLVGCIFVPGPLVIRVGMVLILLLPFIYFMIALKPIYQRHRLVSHGLDPALLTADKQHKIDDEARYTARYRAPR